MSDSLLITGASQLLTLRGETSPRRGASLSKLGIIKDGALLLRGGRIVRVGTRRQVEARPEARRAEKIDVGGRVILPGFVDSHTHLIHAASRAEEYELKIEGASYEEIARKGGGILNSVKKLRAASTQALKSRAIAALQEFASYGTTTVEAKSGYGLDIVSELKILSLHRELSAEQPLEIVSTLLGAHVVPAEFRSIPDGPKKYIQLLIDQLLPEVVSEKLAEFCDVFCDRGAFTREQSRQILTAASSHGLTPRLHAEQLSHTWRHTTCSETRRRQLRSPGTNHRRRYSRALQIANRRHAATGLRLSSWLEAICPCSQTDRRWRHRVAGHRLQSRHQSHRQHAHDSLAGLHAIAHDSRRGRRRFHD